MKAPVNLISGLFLLKFTFAELNIYGHLDPQTLAEGFQTTTACIFALNQTVHCNERRAVVASIADTYYWALDDVITLCTPQCQQSLNSWISDVDAACGNRPIVEDGIIKLASSIPLTYKEGFDLVCLKSGDSWCILESQQWVGSDIIKHPADYCSSGDPEYDGKECYEEGFDQLAIEPEDERMANLYDKDLLCSGCFLKIFRQRLLSPFLLKGGYTSYLVEQFEDMQLKCSTSMPYTTSISEVFMGTVTRTTPTASPLPASTTCQGPIIKPADPPLSCTDIADKYNVTSGEVRHRTGNIDCEFSKPLCLPEPCEIAVVPLDSTCTSFLESHSSSTFNVTINQFLNWNPYLSGSCELINWYQRVCIRPPGGSYENQLPVRQSTAASQYYTPAIPPAPTSTGTTASCGRYYEVVAGDQCNTIARHFGITVDEFLTLNTQVDERCSNLWIAYAYCVAAIQVAPQSTNGLCGPNNGHSTCEGTGFGYCCSTSGYCGSTDSHCGPGHCYSGKCASSNGTSITQDGRCGPRYHDWICGDSTFGKCCSVHGYCGNTPDFCAAGNCYSGACYTDIGGASVDGSCGPSFAGNKTCTGTHFGECCSIKGSCGDGPDYCSHGKCHSGACQGPKTYPIFLYIASLVDIFYFRIADMMNRWRGILITG